MKENEERGNHGPIPSLRLMAGRPGLAGSGNEASKRPRAKAIDARAAAQQARRLAAGLSRQSDSEPLIRYAEELEQYADDLDAEARPTPSTPPSRQPAQQQQQQQQQQPQAKPSGEEAKPSDEGASEKDEPR